jgi:hypothetical protein
MKYLLIILMLMISSCCHTIVPEPKYHFQENVVISRGFYKGIQAQVSAYYSCRCTLSWGFEDDTCSICYTIKPYDSIIEEITVVDENDLKPSEDK